MPKISPQPLTKRLLRLYKFDDEYLRDHYGGDYKISEILRDLIHEFVEQKIAENVEKQFDNRDQKSLFDKLRMEIPL